MEIFEEKENKKESNRSTRILLIINAIIWSIIILMAIFFGKVVNALTTQASEGYTMYFSYGGNSDLKANGSRNIAASVNAINVAMGYGQGTLTGNIYLTIENQALNSSAYNLRATIYNINGANNNASYSKSCVVSARNNGNYDINCQITWNAVSYTRDYFTVRLELPVDTNVLTYITISASTDIQEQTPASSDDIGNQTVSIINSIASNVQDAINNAISNKNDIGDIVNSATNTMQNAIINFMREQNQTCSEYDLYVKANLNDTNIEPSKTGYQLKANGVENPMANWNISKYYTITSGKQYTLTLNQTDDVYYCIYDTTKTLIECNPYNSTNITITPSQDGYIRLTYRNQYRTLTFKGIYCESNTNALIQQLWENNASQIAQLEAVYTAVSPDYEDFDALEDVEDELHEYTNVNLDSFNVDLDIDTSTWVWNTLTSLLNTSSLVFGMVISILSVGIIKLILNR